MTVEESFEDCVSEGGAVAQQLETKQQVEVEGKCVAEQHVEEVKDESLCVVVDSVNTVDMVAEQDGRVECNAVKSKQTFTPEVPLPYGPDDSVEDGKDDEECGFCLFMKAGPCGKRFGAWEACVDDAETSGLNIVDKCAQKTLFLKECMEANPEYYGPILQAEKALDEQTAMEDSKTGDEGNLSNANGFLHTQ